MYVNYVNSLKMSATIGGASLADIALERAAVANAEANKTAQAAVDAIMAFIKDKLRTTHGEVSVHGTMFTVDITKEFTNHVHATSSTFVYHALAAELDKQAVTKADGSAVKFLLCTQLSSSGNTTHRVQITAVGANKS